MLYFFIQYYSLKGLETKVKWQDYNFAMQFGYDEDFEFQQVIPMGELTAIQRKKILDNKQNANAIVIEAFYTFEGNFFEAYYFKDKILLDKIDLK